MKWRYVLCVLGLKNGDKTAAEIEKALADTRNLRYRAREAREKALARLKRREDELEKVKS